MAHITLEESMRGLFYIVKGQYAKKGDSFVNRVTGDVSYIGGYDPTDESTPEWYRVQDNVLHYCVCCGSDLDKCLKAITNQIKRYKTRKMYFKKVCQLTSEDYYEIHYLGHRPLTPEQRSKKAEGRCPRTSPVQRALEEEVYKAYGDYYSDLIKEAEDIAYEEIKNDKPLSKAMKRHKKLSRPVEIQEEETPVVKTQNNTTPSSGVKLKKVRRLGKK